MKLKKQEIKEIIIIISSFLVGGLMMYLLMTNISSTIVIQDKTKIYDKTSLASSIDKVYDTVVVVESFSGSNQDTTGSGFFYKVDNKYAYILTNEHVLTGTTIKITNSSDESEEAEILGKDAYLDLAVLRVNKKLAKKIANFGNSEKMNIGDSIFTIGSPISINYKGTVTSGIISGKDRMVQTSVGDNVQGNWLMQVLQIDAPINNGNSGGPLLNINGDVIGICSLKLTDEAIEGMAFAIPIEYAKNHLEELENGKEMNWPEIGISMTNVANSGTIVNNDIEIPDNIREGVIILNIKKGGSAEKAQLKKGDIIISIDNKKTKNIAYLKYELFQHKIGDKVEVKYIRNGKEETTTVELNSSKK